MITLSFGDVVRLKSLKAILPRESRKQKGMIDLSFSAPKGRVFKVLLLGVEPEFLKPDGPAGLDPQQALKELGYEPKGTGDGQ